MGYYLRKQGLPFVILDAYDRVGDAWRKRWDSLRLFTPAAYDGLPGMPFPASRHSFPSKDQMADYLESYASHFQLPVRVDAKVDRLSRPAGRGFVISLSSGGAIEAGNVVVAMASFQSPRIPPMARELDPAIRQLHSKDYRNPSQLRDGPVLVVGAGNSGAEIALEVARTHTTWLAGRDVGHAPINVSGPLARLILARLLFRVVFHRVLTLSTPIGRKVRPKVLSRGTPLIRIKPPDLARVGVERVPRMVGVKDGKPLLSDQRALEPANIIWCTGFDPGFSWIHLPGFGAQEPEHQRGVVPSEPGLYLLGLEFLYAFSSTMIHGVSRDAGHIVEAIASRSSGPLRLGVAQRGRSGRSVGVACPCAHPMGIQCGGRQRHGRLRARGWQAGQCRFGHVLVPSDLRAAGRGPALGGRRHQRAVRADFAADVGALDHSAPPRYRLVEAN